MRRKPTLVMGRAMRLGTVSEKIVCYEVDGVRLYYIQDLVSTMTSKFSRKAHHDKVHEVAEHFWMKRYS